MQQCWRYKRGWPVDSFLIHLLELTGKVGSRMVAALLSQLLQQSHWSTSFRTYESQTVFKLEGHLVWPYLLIEKGTKSLAQTIWKLLQEKVYVCEGLARIHMSLTLVSRFPVCYLWNLYHIRFNPSHLGLLKEAIKISLIFKDAAISCSFSSCFVACFFATQLSNSALSPDHQHFLGVQHYWNTTQTICIFWLSNIEQTYWDKFWFEPSCHLHKSWRLVIEFPNGVA